VVNKIVGIGFAAYGGQAIEDGGKGYVKGLVWFCFAAVLLDLIPERSQRRFLLSVVAITTPVILVDMIWEPWSW
jgi:hypothetical protein